MRLRRAAPAALEPEPGAGTAGRVWIESGGLAWRAADAPAGCRGGCGHPVRSREQQAGGDACRRSQAETPGRSQADLRQATDDQGQRPRFQPFLERPENVSRARRLNDDQGAELDAQGREPRHVEPPDFIGQRRRPAPQDRAQARGARFRSGGPSSGGSPLQFFSAAPIPQGPDLARREPQSEGDGRRPVPMLVRLHLMEGCWIEPADRQPAIERRRAQIPVPRSPSVAPEQARGGQGGRRILAETGSRNRMWGHPGDPADLQAPIDQPGQLSRALLNRADAGTQPFKKGSVLQQTPVCGAVRRDALEGRGWVDQAGVWIRHGVLDLRYCSFFVLLRAQHWVKQKKNLNRTILHAVRKRLAASSRTRTDAAQPRPPQVGPRKKTRNCLCGHEIVSHFPQPVAKAHDTPGNGRDAAAHPVAPATAHRHTPLRHQTCVARLKAALLRCNT